MHCSNCGNIVKRGDICCSKCGVKLIWKEESNRVDSASKSKIVAIILSVFLGPWSWLYTYKKSAIKFWVMLGLILFFGILYYTPMPGWFFISLFLYLLIFGSWLWALIDTVIKSESFFRNYPNE